MASIKIKSKEFIYDDCFSELINAHSWRVSTQGRAITNIKINRKKVTTTMHQLIIGKKDGFFIDHVNGDYTDNRLSNLRHATPQQNQWNRKAGAMSKTGIKGIGYCHQTNKWRVAITINKQRKTIGRFSCIGTAIKEYNRIAKKTHGEFARLNTRGG